MARFDPTDTLFVSDMDGTLMGSDARVSQQTAQIINDLTSRRGMQFTVATARTIATVIPLMQQVRTALPYITLSGAALWDAVHERFEQVQVIPSELVQQVCDTFERHGVHPFVYRRHGNMVHAHHYGPMSAAEQQFVTERQGTPYKRFLLDDEDYSHSADETMLIFAMNELPLLQDICAELQQRVSCSPMCYHDITNPSLGLIEVYAHGCTKASAIKRLAQQLGARRIVVFGDNLNDLPMMGVADYSIAVSNAVSAVLDCADEVIGPNTADSVALWLKSHLD